MTATEVPANKGIAASLRQTMEAEEGKGWFTGLLPSLSGVDASTASRRPAPGRPSVAAHLEHLRYTFAVLNTWLRQEQVKPDWEEAWKHNEVDEAAWEALKEGFRAQYARLLAYVGEAGDLEERTYWLLSDNLAHTGYHVGSIRLALQIIRG
ncbi:MAG TPA: DinB family protein [Deinococcales bacterium]|nr:DinB family protein [Deinococcales bacterium]